MSTELAPRARVGRMVRCISATWVAAMAWPVAAQVMDSRVHWFALVDQLELAPNRAGTPVSMNGTGWIGGDVNRAWIRLEGDVATERTTGEVQAEAFYGRLLSSYWDAIFGMRLDHLWGRPTATRARLALGLEGLAPYWFELEPTLYLGEDGDVSAQVEAEVELFVTQRLVLQPRLEIQVASKDVPALGVGAGFSDLEIGARLRYDVRRELAPYVGVTWHRRLGSTADLARTAGGYVSNASVVAGVRVWH